MARNMIEGGSAHCAKKHGFRGKAAFQCVGGKRIVARRERGAANIFASDCEVVAEDLGDFCEDTKSFVCDFRADSIAGEDCQFDEHERLF